MGADLLEQIRDMPLLTLERCNLAVVIRKMLKCLLGRRGLTHIDLSHTLHLPPSTICLLFVESE